MSARREIFRGRIIDVDVEEARLPNGKTAFMEIVRHPGGAAAVALDERSRVCLLRQYRHVAGAWLWELPAGKLDAGEPPLQTARRELEEEAGLRAARWESLGNVFSSPGIFTEVVHLYLARDLHRIELNHEEHELIEVHWLPFEHAVEQAQAGQIADAKTVVGLLRAQKRLAST